jgi:catechol 2,3-dioxygenase-like lactoylglutathione lyase family enzyme
MIKGIAHACFTVRDLDKSLDFYCGSLGMTKAFDFTKDGRRTGVYVKAGRRTFIELFQGTVDEVEGKPSFRHICLEVADVEAFVDVLRTKGVEVTDAKLGLDQSWQAWIVDPDGNRIELHSYTDESWQTPWLD